MSESGLVAWLVPASSSRRRFTGRTSALSDSDPSLHISHPSSDVMALSPVMNAQARKGL